MPRFTNSIIQVSEVGDFETQIKKLYTQLRLEATKRPDNFNSFIDNISKTEQDYNYSNVIKDSGSGRTSAGLKSLELLSVMCSGADIANLFLFDNVIFAGSPNEFKSANNIKLINLVIANLGLELIVDSLAGNITQNLRDTALRMGTDVKVGNFYPDMYKKYILTESKKLVRLYIQKIKQIL